ncbi:MAG: EF-hand domain-containing protein [Candidatus Thiodiazotropha sp. (ex Rostrolucina anterorostrata)]|nr:EF-hand domain-containing protein [Candidatus Thiodiazotropha sp. (ex Rostrolucina anterorostrata)]
MKKKTLQQAAVALVAAGFFTAVVAGEDVFSKLDSNADGAISSEEATANEALYKGWEAADANQDGLVDAAEFSAFETSMPAAK